MNVAPLFTVLSSPPPPVATQYVLESDSTTARSTIRPAMFAGPIDRQFIAAVQRRFNSIGPLGSDERVVAGAITCRSVFAADVPDPFVGLSVSDSRSVCTVFRR